MAVPTPSSRPGWHADPADVELIRYWDGAAWTDYTLLKPHGWDASGPGAPLPWWQQWWAVVPALVLCFPVGLVGLWRRPGVGMGPRVAVTAVVLVLFTAVALTNGDAPKDSNEPATAAGAKTSPSSPPTKRPDPAEGTETTESVMPRLVGLLPKAAKRRLDAAHLVVGEITKVPSAQPVGTVLRQGTKQGKTLLAGSVVTVAVAVAYPRVPNVAGDAQRQAARALRRGGFEVRVTTEVRTSGRDGAVLSQTPAGSARIKPGSVVTIVVADVVKPEPPPEVQNCTSGYSPCLAPAYDYDCAEGSGDGPEYAYGPVRVTGSDPYDLDSDGDGVACES